jgi:hypothetical protein
MSIQMVSKAALIDAGSSMVIRNPAERYVASARAETSTSR